MNSIQKLLHKHEWEYERHNALIIRACNCGIVEEGFINEEPTLISTAPIRKNDFAAIKWKKI